MKQVKQRNEDTVCLASLPDCLSLSDLLNIIYHNSDQSTMSNFWLISVSCSSISHFLNSVCISITYIPSHRLFSHQHTSRFKSINSFCKYITFSWSIPQYKLIQNTIFIKCSFTVYKTLSNTINYIPCFYERALKCVLKQSAGVTDL